MNELANNVTVQFSHHRAGAELSAGGRRGVRRVVHGARARVAAAGGIEREDQRAPQPVRAPQGPAAARRHRGERADRRRASARSTTSATTSSTTGSAPRGPASGSQPSQNNFIGNFYLAGPGGDNPVGRHQHRGHDVVGRDVDLLGQRRDQHQGLSLGQPQGRQQGRRRERRGRAGEQRLRIVGFQGAAYTQTPYYGATETATTAFMRVLDYTGARWWSRAAVDTRLVSETRAGTGKIVGVGRRSVQQQRVGGHRVARAGRDAGDVAAGRLRHRQRRHARHVGDGARPQPGRRRRQRRRRRRRLHEPRGVHQRDRRVARDRAADVPGDAQPALRGDRELARARRARDGDLAAERPRHRRHRGGDGDRRRRRAARGYAAGRGAERRGARRSWRWPAAGSRSPAG